MSFWDWFATGEVLFLGRFAEAHHLPNTPTPNVIEVCLNLDDKTRVQNPASLMADLMASQRFIDTQPPGQTIIDKWNGTRITFIDASTLPYRPPMVPLAQARSNFDSAIADSLDLIALGIFEVAAGTDIDDPVLGPTITRLAKRIITPDSPLLMFSDTQRELVLGHLTGFELEFVIPQKYIKAAADLLVTSGYAKCTDPSCNELTNDRTPGVNHPAEVIVAWNRFHAVGVSHFHMKDDFVVHLLPQSNIIPWLPEIQPGPPADDDADLMLTTDRTLPAAAENGPSGAWRRRYPVKILNPDSFTESVLWLFCRDFEHDEDLSDRWCDMKMALRDDAMFTKCLRPELRAAWACYNRRDEYYAIHMYREILLLRERLIADGRLPKNLPVIDIAEYQDPVSEYYGLAPPV
ncbi:uncharacterized protein APUU_61240S [Aspergillus puulaauensis]|uniref:Uncharacterized protein n=1 Tax=Aspergillus puulaauensis TaxID=1220207 RepID=A0A7R7XUW8_9EURO|nr:uncharacterized protein APUU_61240S [Aspergillus puulaauensis]BCS28192.1 hypothetical protein APUU_61240S [Aspergillus puulaauensis]